MQSFSTRAAAGGALFGFTFILLLSTASEACTSCGCSVVTDWTGTELQPATGLRLSARYDYVDQNTLHSGNDKVDTAAITLPSDDELQQYTLTRFYTIGADYSLDTDWSLNAELPWLDRDHATIAEDSTAVTTSHTRGIGDLRLLARYNGSYGGLLPGRVLGLQFGLKLPTGAFHDVFSDGPAAGETIDRGLQNGTGTTDLLLGVYNAGSLAPRWQRYEQLQLKQPLNSREGFKPSTQLMLNLGLRYVATPWLAPQLQLNGRIEGRELGPQGDYDNSGSQTLYLSPGLTVGSATGLSGYGFVQLPVYQHYTGSQLAPDYLVSVGLSYRY